MVIVILFHSSGFRCLKHFYKEYVCVHLRYSVVQSFYWTSEDHYYSNCNFIIKVLLGKCTGISFVDSTPLRVCRNKRIHTHKTFKGIFARISESVRRLQGAIQSKPKPGDFKSPGTYTMLKKWADFRICRIHQRKLLWRTNRKTKCDDLTVFRLINTKRNVIFAFYVLV